MSLESRLDSSLQPLPGDQTRSQRLTTRAKGPGSENSRRRSENTPCPNLYLTVNSWSRRDRTVFLWDVRVRESLTFWRGGKGGKGTEVQTRDGEENKVS